MCSSQEPGIAYLSSLTTLFSLINFVRFIPPPHPDKQGYVKQLRKMTDCITVYVCQRIPHHETNREINFLILDYFYELLKEKIILSSRSHGTEFLILLLLFNEAQQEGSNSPRWKLPIFSHKLLEIREATLPILGVKCLTQCLTCNKCLKLNVLFWVYLIFEAEQRNSQKHLWTQCLLFCFWKNIFFFQVLEH